MVSGFIPIFCFCLWSPSYLFQALEKQLGLLMLKLYLLRVSWDTKMCKNSSGLLNKTDLFVYYSVIQLNTEVVLWQETLSGASGWHYILIWRREAAAGQKQQKYSQGEEECQKNWHCISVTSYISRDSRFLNGSMVLNSITLLYWKILEQFSETKSSPRWGKEWGEEEGRCLNSFSLVTTEKPRIESFL